MPGFGPAFFGLDAEPASLVVPESQRKVLEALAGHIAIAVENARLFGHEKLTREKLEKENFEAQRIQAALLPKPRPLIRGFALEGLCVPVRAVGGDWFDYFPISENEWGVVLGDVSGRARLPRS